MPLFILHATTHLICMYKAALMRILIHMHTNLVIYGSLSARAV